jgi:hypothetical protein
MDLQYYAASLEGLYPQAQCTNIMRITGRFPSAIKYFIKPQLQTETNTIMAEAIRYNIEPRRIQFDGFPVARLLPKIGLNGVGPWLFFDHMGPHKFEVGQGLDVPPHPTSTLPP